MSTQNSEFTRKLRAAVRAKVEEYGIDVDDELPDYVMIMVGNKKDKNRMKTDLKLFLGENTSDFVEWLFGFFQKVKATPLNASTSTVLPRPEPSTSEAKQKERQPIVEDEHVAANTDQGGKISNKPSQKPKVKPSKFARTTESIRLRKKEKSPGLRSRKIADDKEDEPFPSQTARSTTFAVPRPVLRSVVAVVNSCQSSAHPRIRPRTPSPGVDSTEIAEFSPTSPSPKSMQHQFADYRREEAAPADIPHKRRVLAAAKSLLFQRALPQSSQNLVNFEKNTNEKEVEEEKEHDQLDFVVNEPTENVTITMLGEEEEDGARQPQQQQKAKSSGRQNGSAFPGIAGSLFQRAIQETKKQTEGATHNQHNFSNKKLHTSAEGEEQTSATQKEDEDGPESKKIRIEWESAEAHSGIEEDESVLVINFDKSTSRSIRKGQRKAKSGLTLLKEHIGVGARTAAVKEHSEEQLSSGEHGNAKSALEIDEKEEAQPSSDLERNSRIGKMHIKNASSSTASARLWDGRIEIDDLSSTDDEAEIDALLEQQHKLKKMALEREKELKGRELPPTAALTRPLFYQPEVVSQQSVPEQRQPLSPNETNLLPAIFQPQLAAVQPQFVVTQQQPQLSITRPHATVAPSLSTTSVPTTPATSSISMFLRQNSLQLHTQQQFAHPYSIGNSRHPQMASPQSHNTTASYNYKSKAAHSKMYSPAPAGLVHSGFAGSTTTTTMEKDLAYQTRLFLIKLREQHRQLTQSYANMLEEQRLILAQIQKMASNKNSGEQRKNLLFRCKQMEKNAQQIKAQLESLSRRMAELSKFGGNLTNVV